jgi:hypothetical protein
MKYSDFDCYLIGSSSNQAHEQVMRNFNIYVDRKKNMTFVELSDKYKVKIAQCRSLYLRVVDKIKIGRRLIAKHGYQEAFSLDLKRAISYSWSISSLNLWYKVHDFKKQLTGFVKRV